MHLLKDKTALITGGGTGIGKAIAFAFASEGCSIVLTGRNEERLNRTLEEITARTSASVSVVAADITYSEQVRSLFKKILKIFGKLDVLVNNAGAFDGAPIEQVTDEQWHRVMGVNVNGVFYCTREAFPIMKAQGGGRIINIGSIAAFRPREESLPYSTSKSALAGLTNAAALEGRESGITVSALHPGNVMVERRADKRSQTGRDMGPEHMIAAEDIARTALLMATLPQETNLLEAIVIPTRQKYLGRG